MATPSATNPTGTKLFEAVKVECIHGENGKPKPAPFDKIQLCAQALCLEEMTGQTITEGALWYGQTRHRLPVVFSDSLRQTTRATIEQVCGLLESGITSTPQYSKRCKVCSLVEICQPALLRRNSLKEYVSKLFLIPSLKNHLD